MQDKKTKRVLHVLGSLNVGGKEMCAMNFYRYINKEEIQFDFAIFQNDKNHFDDEVLSLGGKVFYCGESKKGNSFLRTLDDIKSLRKLLKQTHYDIVHCHGCSFFAILEASLAAKLEKVKVVIAHAHNPGTPKQSIIDTVLRIILKKLITYSCNQYFTCSDVAAESKYETKLIESNRVTYIHNAINIEKFKYSQVTRDFTREQLGIKKEDFVLGIIGRLENQKNHYYLIDIFEKYVLSHDNAKLLIVGDGSLRSALETKVQAKHLKDKVIFTGSVNNPYDYYQAMDSFVLPSLYEGFPFVLVEAQANGLPCIISSNITSQVCILKSTEQLSIDVDPIVWVNAISKYQENPNDRAKGYDILNELGYNIVDESARLEKMYKAFLEK